MNIQLNIEDCAKNNGGIKIIITFTPTISTMIHSMVQLVFDGNTGFIMNSTKNSKNHENQ